jgi:hypothetical protein
MNRGGSVSIWTRLRAGWPGLDVRQRQGRTFSLRPRVQTGYGAHPATFPTNKAGYFSADKYGHSFPSNAEVKNTWSYASTPQYIFMSSYLLKHRDNFNFNNGTVSCKSRDSSVGIALGYELDDRDSKVRFLARDGNFSLLHRIQNGSGAHPASYSAWAS